MWRSAAFSRQRMRSVSVPTLQTLDEEGLAFAVACFKPDGGEFAPPVYSPRTQRADGDLRAVEEATRGGRWQSSRMKFECRSGIDRIRNSQLGTSAFRVGL